MTGVNKSVSFARWQQGVGFVVPRTTACFVMPSRNVVWLEAYCFCPVRLSVHWRVCPRTLIQYLAEYLTHFYQTYISGALWDGDECITICVEVEVTVEETALGGLVKTCLERY